MDDQTRVALKREFGYAPDEAYGEKWVIYKNNFLVVVHPEQRPKVFERGCAGLYFEIEPDFK